MAADVFISYARSTEQLAEVIEAGLVQAGFTVWRDRDLPFHRPYPEVIEEHLRAARAVVVVWSEAALSSDWVRSEADLARKLGSMVQVSADGAAPPMPFSQFQCGDFAGWTGDLHDHRWRKLLESISQLTTPAVSEVEVQGPHPRPTQPGLAPGQRRWRVWTSMAAVAAAVGVVATVWWANERTRAATWTVVSREMVANTALDEAKPDLSADGRFLAYDAAPTPGGHRVLYFRNLSAGDATLLTNDAKWDDFAPAFSPTARDVAFVRMPASTSPGDTKIPPCRIMIKPFPDGLERLAGRCETEPYTTRLSWSNSGDALFFADRPQSPAGTPWRIRRLDLKSGIAKDVTQPPAGSVGDFNPTISPDGRTLAFARHPTDESVIVFTQDLASGRVRQITHNGVGGYIAWAPDGRSVLVSEYSGSGDIWAYPASGHGDPKGLGAVGSHGRIAAAGNLIAYEVLARSSRIAAIVAGKEAEITTGERNDITPEYSPAGVLAFISNDAPISLWVKQPSEPARMLAKLPVSFASDPRWSPDGTTIAFLGIEGGAARYFLLDVERQALTSIDPGGHDVGAPAWTPDGRSLVYPEREAAGWRLWRRELKGTSKPEPVSAFGWRYVRIADGATYAVRERGPGVWRLDKAGLATLVAPEVNIDPQDVDDSAHGWTVSAGRIYFIDQRQGLEHVRVLSRPVQGGPATPVADGLDWAGGPSLDWYGGLAVNPRSGAIAYAKSGRRDNDIAVYHLVRK